MKEQAENRRPMSAKIGNPEVDGARVNFSKLARAHGMDRGTISYRLKKGWSLEHALSEPLRYGRPRTNLEG